MTRDPASARFELDYLGELQKCHGSIQRALAASMEVLADAALTLATLASLELTTAASDRRLAVMHELAGKLAAARPALTEGADSLLAAVELLAGRLHVIASEAGIGPAAE